MRHFATYVDELADLLAGADPKRVMPALDGGVSAELRSRLALRGRRSRGAFFTPQKLARRLVACEELDGRVIVDPALGGGDLLLAAAARLPLGRSVSETLQSWGRVLDGTDLEEQFVRAARIRLALMAASRLGKATRLGEERLEELLPWIRIGNGRREEIAEGATILLNPPYGATAAPKRTPWGGGQVSRAALFTAEVLERSPGGNRLAAILPDVLRSGTHYARWRAHIETMLKVEAVERIGQFDAWADIDVFILRGKVEHRQNPRRTAKWMGRRPAQSIGDYCIVEAGLVVPHRDPLKGPSYRYLTVHDLPLGGTFEIADAPWRRYHGRVFQPPFVVVRRTSRPDQLGNRALATVVTGTEPVAVENIYSSSPREPER